MKIQNKYIGTIFFILLACLAGAQNSQFDWNKLSDSSNRLQGKLIGKIYYITALDNSKFLHPGDWVNGSITLTDGDTFEDIELRYNILQDELIAYNENYNTLYFVEKELVKSFLFDENGRARKFIKLRNGKSKNKQQYFEELYVGDINLVAFRYVYQHTVSPYIDKMGIMRDIEYRLSTDYYLYYGNESFQKIVPKRNAFLKIFAEHKKEIKKLFRNNNLFLHDEQSLIRALHLLDEAGLLK